MIFKIVNTIFKNTRQIDCRTINLNSRVSLFDASVNLKPFEKNSYKISSEKASN